MAGQVPCAMAELGTTVPVEVLEFTFLRSSMTQCTLIICLCCMYIPFSTGGALDLISVAREFVSRNARNALLWKVLILFYSSYDLYTIVTLRKYIRSLRVIQKYFGTSPENMS